MNDKIKELLLQLQEEIKDEDVYHDFHKYGRDYTPTTNTDLIALWVIVNKILNNY